MIRQLLRLCGNLRARYANGLKFAIESGIADTNGKKRGTTPLGFLLTGPADKPFRADLATLLLEHNANPFEEVSSRDNLPFLHAMIYYHRYDNDFVRKLLFDFPGLVNLQDLQVIVLHLC